MLVNLSILTPPEQEILSLDLIKQYIRIDNDVEDLLLSFLHKAARQELEGLLGRAFFTQTLQAVFTFDTVSLTLPPYQGISLALQLPRPPIQEVTKVEIEVSPETYQETTLFTHSQDRLNLKNEVMELLTWGNTLPQARVTYTAGYATVESVPEQYKVLLLKLVTHKYGEREAGLPEGFSKEIMAEKLYA